MVSVIIPIYNRAGTIERSIISVLNQTVRDLEVIIVDDCSDDELNEVLAGIKDDRLHYLRLDKRSGACAARNRGIEIARGDYIALQDSDDEWHNNKLEIQLNAIINNNADVCSCMLNRHYPGNNAKVIEWPEKMEKGSRFIDAVSLRRRSQVSSQTIIAKRDVFEDIKFDENVIKSQDYDWVIRASEKYSVYFITEPLVEQYLQADSITMCKYNIIVESRLYLLKKYEELGKKDPEFKYQLLQQLAHYKSLDDANAGKEYFELFKIKKRPHDLFCALFSKMHIRKRSAK